MTRLPTLAAILCIAIVVGTASASTSVPSMPSSVAPSMPSSVAPSTTVASESVSASMAKTTSIAPSSSVTPKPTPTPDPTDNNYIVHDENNAKAVCLHMKAGLSLEFEYSIGKDKTAKVVDLKNTTVEVHPNSSCSKANLVAVLKLEYTPRNMEPHYFVTFHFNGTSSDSLWTASNITIEFTFNTDNFPNYNGSLTTNSSINSTSPGPLFDGGQVGLNNSFACNVNRTISSFSPSGINKSLNVSLFVADFQVQAFDFLNATSGEFDHSKPHKLVTSNSSVPCAEANTGNKIVPIAVGAALAGLVIVVLIAYLIGRLRNRKKSSYEALS